MNKIVIDDYYHMTLIKKKLYQVTLVHPLSNFYRNLKVPFCTHNSTSRLLIAFLIYALEKIIPLLMYIVCIEVSNNTFFLNSHWFIRAMKSPPPVYIVGDKYIVSPFVFNRCIVQRIHCLALYAYYNMYNHFLQKNTHTHTHFLSFMPRSIQHFICHANFLEYPRFVFLCYQILMPLFDNNILFQGLGFTVFLDSLNLWSSPPIFHMNEARYLDLKLIQGQISCDFQGLWNILQPLTITNDMKLGSLTLALTNQDST